MSSLLAALSFLTVIPARRAPDVTQQVISNSRAWFPLVGLFLGLLLVGMEWVLSFVFPFYVNAALLVVFLAAITRALHLDGLMDTCDGLFGGSTPERRREIMRDPHVGAFGVVGAICVLLLKYAALAAVLSMEWSGSGWEGRQAGWFSYAQLEDLNRGGLASTANESVLILFPVISRYAMVLQLMSFRYVRTPGLGSPFHAGDGRLPSAVAATIAVVAALAVGGLGGMITLAGVCLLALLLGRAMAAMAGGMTGDCYGATNELCEVAVLLAGVVLLRYGLFGPDIWLGPVFQFLI